MRTVRLKGKSRKGKNRVANFGEFWNVTKQEGNCIWVRPVEDPNIDFRCINIKEDKDFDVTEVEQLPIGE